MCNGTYFVIRFCTLSLLFWPISRFSSSLRASAAPQGNWVSLFLFLSLPLSLRFTSQLFFRCLPHWARRDQEPSCVPFAHFLALVVSLSLSLSLSPSLDPTVDHATPTKAKRDANTGPTNAELLLSWRPLVSDLASAAWRVSPRTNERFERVFICACLLRARTRAREIFAERSDEPF